MAEFVDIHIKHGDEVYVLDDRGEYRVVGMWVHDETLGDQHSILRIQHNEIEKL